MSVGEGVTGKCTRGVGWGGKGIQFLAAKVRVMTIRMMFIANQESIVDSG